MKTSMQKMSDLIKWEDVDLKTTSIYLQEEEKQQILDAFAHGMLSQMLVNNFKRRQTIDELAHEYYEIFYNQNQNYDDKI